MTPMIKADLIVDLMVVGYIVGVCFTPVALWVIGAGILKVYNRVAHSL